MRQFRWRGYRYHSVVQHANLGGVGTSTTVYITPTLQRHVWIRVTLSGTPTLSAWVRVTLCPVHHHWRHGYRYHWVWCTTIGGMGTGTTGSGTPTLSAWVRVPLCPVRQHWQHGYGYHCVVQHTNIQNYTYLFVISLSSQTLCQ